MKRIFLAPLGAVLLFPYTSVPATPAEKVEATRLCAEVVRQGSPRLRSDDIRNICEASSRPAQVWSCAKERMDEGTRFGPAIEHCETARK